MIEALIAALFGLLIGSFLNVCIYRMPRDLSVVAPRSFCPTCERPVAWFDNVPVFSYVMLRARCRYCRKSIPWRYPVVELLTAVFFFIGVYSLGPTLAALKFCIFSAILIALIFTDLEERILPDEFTLGGTAIGIALAWFVPFEFSLLELFLPQHWSLPMRSVAESALTAGLLAGMLWSIAVIYEKVRGREGLGFGDVKMVACMGAFLGLAPALFSIVLGSILGSVVGLAFIWFSRKDATTYELPFGSFLGIAGLIMALRAGPMEAWLQ